MISLNKCDNSSKEKYCNSCGNRDIVIYTIGFEFEPPMADTTRLCYECLEKLTDMFIFIKAERCQNKHMEPDLATLRCTNCRKEFRRFKNSIPDDRHIKCFSCLFKGNAQDY